MVEQLLSEDALIEFHTCREWAALDLAAAMQGLDAAYSAIVLAGHLGIAAQREHEIFVENADAYWEVLDKFGRPHDLTLEAWRKLVRRLGPRGVRALSPHITVPPDWLSPTLSMSDATAQIDYYLDHPDDFMQVGQELAIHQIHISSPGGFTLRGLGEPIQQLRELIKDWWYRNRQEQQLGEIEIVKKKLDLAAKHNLSPQQLHVLAVYAINSSEELKQLIASGMLNLTGVEPRQIESSARATRRRRRKGPPKRDAGT